MVKFIIKRIALMVPLMLVVSFNVSTDLFD